MDFLLLLRVDGLPFDEAAVFKAITALPGLEKADREQRIDALLEAHIWHDKDATIVRLSEDRARLSLSGSSPAAFFAAFELGRRLGVPTRIVDSNYVIDVPIDEVASPEDLQSRYETASGGA